MNAITLNVRVSGPLAAHVNAKVGPTGRYDNISEYIRDLIRRELAEEDRERFNVMKAELTRAFATPEADYVTVTAGQVIARNKRGRSEG